MEESRDAKPIRKIEERRVRPGVFLRDRQMKLTGSMRRGP